MHTLRPASLWFLFDGVHRRQTGNWPETLVLYRKRPPAERRAEFGRHVGVGGGNDCSRHPQHFSRSTLCFASIHERALNLLCRRFIQQQRRVGSGSDRQGFYIPPVVFWPTHRYVCCAPVGASFRFPSGANYEILSTENFLLSADWSTSDHGNERIRRFRTLQLHSQFN